jgi:phosphoglycolate phosphatase
MNGKHILFDLDGTLTDSGEGIINCASLALAHFGIPVPDRQTMRAFVGPPLSETFESFGVPAHLTDAAIAVYRSRYTTVGKFENTPYPGIRELLEDLKAQEHHLYVATSKPEGLAQEILEKFELSKYFDQICGATLDKSRSKKEDVIAYLLSQVQTDQNTVIVGDTVYDIIGAAIHGIPAVGVSWGYGNVADMRKSGAVAIADTPADLLIILNSGL